ncbi:hypothetical protein H6F74_19735 [Trichocoleus sp. FACHB-90]|uniref:hypothetical protein n=1 Tax=Cyanophyceae TaxID=3028117 RepID=UPI001688A935|nr:hypothetical protein [Trichocoleus sp. FACHB-90]MBD1928461.1 hypothetical protein [Trichocoleus sp. FACHB-90]
MLDLPYPILDYLYKLTIRNCSLAYLFVEKNGWLSNWGGNLAARLESQARPKEIFIDEHTFQKIDRLQEKFSQTTLPLTGIVEPIKIYSCLVKS